MIVNTFIPKYMKSFKCIGSKCTDTCCAGWDVNIDENSYFKYKNSTGELKELVDGKFVANKNESDFFNAGFMILKEKSRCPFLNDKMLCDIHGNIGEESLCITCKSYPRVFNIIDDVYEKSALTSCEEICNLALRIEKMEFIESEEEIDEDNIEIRRIIDTEAFAGTDSLLQYFWEIRIASINILQCKIYTIEERLGILKGFYCKINSLKEIDDFESIEEILDEFSKENVDCEKYKNDFNDTDDIFIKMLLEEELINAIRSPRLKKYAVQYKNKITVENKNNIDFKNDEKIEKALNHNDYVLENYLVNQIFKDLIPFNKGENIIESIDSLINIYKLIKEYIKGIANDEKEVISQEDIIGVIQAVSKDIEHNKVFTEIINYRA